MKWQFNLTEGSKNINLKAEVVFTTYQIEEIKVTGEGISILLMNNRPLLEAIELRQPLTWRLVSGQLKNQDLLTRIKKELERHLVKPGTASQPVTTPAQETKPAIPQPAAKNFKETGRKPQRA